MPAPKFRWKNLGDGWYECRVGIHTVMQAWKRLQHHNWLGNQNRWGWGGSVAWGWFVTQDGRLTGGGETRLKREAQAAAEAHALTIAEVQ